MLGDIILKRPVGTYADPWGQDNSAIVMYEAQSQMSLTFIVCQVAGEFWNSCQISIFSPSTSRSPLFWLRSAGALGYPTHAASKTLSDSEHSVVRVRQEVGDKGECEGGRLEEGERIGYRV
jgi:hypothetical protein